MSMIEARAEMYAKDIAEQGAPFDNCICFMECNKIKMYRPGGRKDLQRATYSRHKRFNCLIYQIVTKTDGLIFYLCDPEVGRRHDMVLYRKSGLGAILADGMFIKGKQFCIYGEAAYMMLPWIQVAYPRTNATADELDYKVAMSAVREAIEWT